MDSDAGAEASVTKPVTADARATADGSGRIWRSPGMAGASWAATVVQQSGASMDWPRSSWEIAREGSGQSGQATTLGAPSPETNAMSTRLVATPREGQCLTMRA